MKQAQAGSRQFWSQLEVLLNMLFRQEDSTATDAAKDELLDYFIKDTYIVHFRSKEGTQVAEVNACKGNFPFFDLFLEETGNLTNGSGFFGGCSLFRAECEDNRWSASFVTNLPDRMKFEIEKSEKLELLAIDKASPDTLVEHIKKPVNRKNVQHPFWQRMQLAYELLGKETRSEEEDRVLASILDYLSLDTHLVSFGFAPGAISADVEADPAKSDLLLNLFDEQIGLFSGNGYFGGCSVFHPKKAGDSWNVSFLCNIPERMEFEIRSNPHLIFLDCKKADPALLRAHLAESFHY